MEALQVTDRHLHGALTITLTRPCPHIRTQFTLLTLDIIQAMGQVLSIRWAYMGKVEVGGYCTTQGLFQQFGECGVAITTLAITVHTFVSVFWRKGVHNRRAALVVVGLIILFVSLFVGIGAGVHNDSDAPYITPTPVSKMSEHPAQSIQL